jgi:hypothetical protein
MIVADTLARRQVVFTGTAAPLSIQFEVDDTSELRRDGRCPVRLWSNPLETFGNVLFECSDQLFHETGDRSHDLVGEDSAITVSVEGQLKLVVDRTTDGIRELQDDTA